MYKVYKRNRNEIVAIHEETGKKVTFTTPLPFKSGDQIVRVDDNIGFAMVDKFEELLAQEILENSKEDSEEWEYAKQVLIDKSKNPTFLVGEKLIDFLATREAMYQIVD